MTDVEYIDWLRTIKPGDRVSLNDGKWIYPFLVQEVSITDNSIMDFMSFSIAGELTTGDLRITHTAYYKLPPIDDEKPPCDRSIQPLEQSPLADQQVSCQKS